jgi:transcriptional regulator with XRE-family HTH domain
MTVVERNRKATEPSDPSIGVALRDIRETHDISARQLSDDSGISPAMISRIENGQVSPSIATMAALSEALDVPLASLFRDVASERTDFTHVKKGKGVVSTRMMGDHIHHYVNLAVHRRRDLNFEAHLVTVRQQDCPPPSYVGHGVVFIHVLGGRAIFKYGKQSITLEPGDNLSIDAELTHGVSDVLTDEFVFLSVQAEARR